MAGALTKDEECSSSRRRTISLMIRFSSSPSLSPSAFTMSHAPTSEGMREGSVKELRNLYTATYMSCVLACLVCTLYICWCRKCNRQPYQRDKKKRLMKPNRSLLSPFFAQNMCRHGHAAPTATQNIAPLVDMVVLSFSL